MNIIIAENQAGERIDKFLADEMGEYSRSQIQKMIKEGIFSVNGKTMPPHYAIKAGDNIKRIEVKKTAMQKKKTETIKRAESGLLKKIKIIDDAPDYLVVNKPAGLIVHGAKHIKEETLADAIIKKYPEIKKVGDDPKRPGIVHRLDKEASGLMVIAKNQKTFLNLKKQFQKRKVGKEYIALTYGKIERGAGEINFPIRRSALGHKMAALPLTVGREKNLAGREAVTEYEIITRYINYTLLRLIIKTGRTHQIRVHLAAFGHPIVGDDLYSTKKTRDQNKKLMLGRIFLSAVKLSFSDLKKIKKTYKIELPGELKKFLKTVK